MLEKWNHCISCDNSSVKGSMLYIYCDSQCYYLLISQGKEMSFTKANLGKKTMIKHWKFSIEDLHDTDFCRESHTPY